MIFGKKEKSEYIKDLNNQKKLLKKAVREEKTNTKELKEINLLKKDIDKYKKRAKRVPKTVQNSIYYQQMYEDGICKINEYEYSKTIRFNDINYQIAPKEIQFSTFEKYCDFLNGLSPNNHIQLTIHNRKISDEEFRENIFIESNSDYPLVYLNEFNDMLRMNTLDSTEAKICEKYITFTVKAEDYNDATKSLNRAEAEIQNNFKSLKCHNYVLNGYERVKILHSIMKPFDNFMFNYSKLLKSSLTTKDFISPVMLNFKKIRYFTTPDYFATTLWLRDLPSDLSDIFLQELCELNCNIIFTLHIDPIDKSSAIDMINNKIMLMDQQKIDEIKKAVKNSYDPEMIPDELKRNINAAIEFKEDLISRGQNMYKVSISIYTYDENFENLQNNIYKIVACGNKHQCKIDYLDLLQKEGLNSTLPLGKCHINNTLRTLTTASTAVFIPFSSQELFQKQGTVFGINSLSKSLLKFDRKTLKTPSGFVLATPGSGKSFFTKLEVMQVLYASNEEDIIYIDFENETRHINSAFNGTFIDVKANSDIRINPFEIDSFGENNEDLLSIKSDFIVSMIRLIVGDIANFDMKYKPIIDRCVRNIYLPLINRKDLKSTDMPTFSTFREMLLTQSEAEAKELALALEIYVEGSIKMFNGYSNVDLNNRFVSFGLHELGNQLKPLALFILLEYIQNRVIENFKKGKWTRISVEEYYLLLKNEYTRNYFYVLFKRIRKFGGILTCITQNVEDTLRDEDSRAMLSNSEFVVLFNQSAIDGEILSNLLNISSQQMSHITNSAAGHGLFIAEGVIIPFENDVPVGTELYKLLSTKFSERVAHE